MLSHVAIYSVARAYIYIIFMFATAMTTANSSDRCLLTLNPKICPLCRDQFEPNELEKLHVDRPENVDENKENNLLQKLVFSWEAPEVQLRRLALEVDKWLGTRADDTVCILSLV